MLKHRVRRAVVAVAVFTLITACVPTKSTIGGHIDAEIQTWADQARAMCLQRTGQVPASSFTTDGCTLWPDSTWQACCVHHDMAYWCGGSGSERRAADDQLRRCTSEHGGGSLEDTVMYWGTRIGGHPWFPTYWRWGYGWPWPRGYRESSGR